MALEEYRGKRNFRHTPEPPARTRRQNRQPIFVIQEHHASRLHYDFRLEADGVLKSWAVPKEPTLDPAQKRLAVHVEDHPLDYADFHGTIPEGQYGAGKVSIWDRGTYENLLADKPVPQSMAEGLDAGHLEFVLHGRKLRGRFALIRMKGKKYGGKDNWLLIKMKDDFARPGYSEEKKTASRPLRKAATKKESRPAPSPGKVAITNPDKILFPEAEITKGAVVEYYRRIAPRLLPYLKDRPITLERLPEGLGEGNPHFWQKNTPSYYPDWIPRVDLPTENGKPVSYVLVNNKETLLYLVNQGTLTFHTWFSRIADLDRPDFVLFDLDRGQAPLSDLVLVARSLHDLLTKEKIRAFLKTSGKTGLHVLVPWDREGGYDKSRAWALEQAKRVVDTLPNRATVEIRKVNRGKFVYIDIMQNVRGHHAVPPYVLRAVPGAPVSTPLRWQELNPNLDPGKFNIQTFFGRLARLKSDPWAPLARRLSGRALAGARRGK